MTVLHQENMLDERLFVVKDPISALTHLIGAIGALIGMPILLIHGSLNQVSLYMMIALTIFMMSMIILYSASTVYHSFSINAKVNKILKKVDHCSIFLLIAGSYTPVAVGALHGTASMVLLIAIWLIAIIGIIFKLFWVTCPKWVSSVIYTAMGWVCVFFLKDILASISFSGFIWLLIGGLFYTVGAVIYALKPNWFHFKMKGFGNHELFHCFVLAGSLCHYIFVFFYLI